MQRVKITLKKGGLPNYHINDNVKVRRKILMNLLKTNKATYSEMIKRINILSIYNKNKNPEMSNRFARDITFLQEHAAPKYSLTILNKKLTARTN